MFYVLQCGGIPFNGDTIKTQSLGGSESAAYYLAKELASAGHRVTLFTNTQSGGIFDGVRYEPMGNITQETPLGENFHYYATNTPHDVCILQRHPMAFAYRWASKVNLWWLHDLALYRSKGEVQSQLWNIDRVLTVSEYHSDQVANVYGIDKSSITSIKNGVGKEAYSEISEINETACTLKAQGKNVLTYSSRPERGLEHLLRPGGIMDRLGDDYHLVFCGYENTTPVMADYYHMLWGRAEQMSNVTNLGAITKSELSDLMSSSDLHIYPTQFEEVSCITAMECMAANLPMVTSAHAALPETCDGAGVELIPLKDGEVDEDGFIAFTESFFGMGSEMRQEMADAQSEAAKKFTWESVADRVQAIVMDHMTSASDSSIAADYARNSDILAMANQYDVDSTNGIVAGLARETVRLYDWISCDEDVAAHYATRTEPLARADVTSTPRFKHVARVVHEEFSGQSGMRMLDYGCNAGHYSIPLAKRYPECHFIGLDFDEKAVAFARDWAFYEGASNVEFFTPQEFLEANPEMTFDVSILCEVVEHVPDVHALFDRLPQSDRWVITTPYGPWESLSFDKMMDYREHIHHFERQDLHELFGGIKGFRVLNIPHPTPSLDLSLGSYVIEFDGRDDFELGHIDYDRKQLESKPTETVSACLLVGNSEETILKCLRSLWSQVDEIVLRFDAQCNEATVKVVKDFLETSYGSCNVVGFTGYSPTEIGFDAARNETVERASGDWIIWIDTDEEVLFRDGWKGLLRQNPLSGYATAQKHFSADPAGVIKTDYPVRLFRNNGIKFFGMVHEHPERELNEGVGSVQLTNLIEVMHYGYKNEDVRRGRFKRNFSLLVQDREKYPERKLGAMLWIRDCGQRIQYAMEENGGRITKELKAIALDGVQTWEWLAKEADLRMVCESLEFYSVCVEALCPGVEAAIAIGISEIPNGIPDSLPTSKGVFYNREHIKMLTDRMLDQGQDVDKRYI